MFYSKLFLLQTFITVILKKNLEEKGNMPGCCSLRIGQQAYLKSGKSFVERKHIKHRNEVLKQGSNFTVLIYGNAVLV